jgi:hypothetical protein
MDEQKIISDAEKQWISLGKTIFTQDNLGAIVYRLNSLIPFSDNRIGISEYDTVITNVRIQGMIDLVNALSNQINPRQ